MLIYNRRELAVFIIMARYHYLTVIWMINHCHVVKGRRGEGAV